MGGASVCLSPSFFMTGRGCRGHNGAANVLLFFTARVHGKASAETVNTPLWPHSCSTVPPSECAKPLNAHEADIGAAPLAFSHWARFSPHVGLGALLSLNKLISKQSAGDWQVDNMMLDESQYTVRCCWGWLLVRTLHVAERSVEVM